MKLAKAIVLSGLLVTGGCGSNLKLDSQTAGWIGAGAGMLVGGWAGGQLGGGSGALIATGLGAIAGGSIGYEAGRTLLVADHDVYERAIFNALGKSQRQTSWQNAKSGTSGYVSTQQAYRDGGGRDCRTYRATVAFNDEVISGDGAACLNNDGNWALVADAFQ